MATKRKPKTTARSVAVDILKQVIASGRSLREARAGSDVLSAQDRGLCMNIVYGVLRHRWSIQHRLDELLKKPLKNKDLDISLILLAAVFELRQLKTPDYAVVDEAVEQCRQRGKPWACAMTNAVLRNVIRQSSNETHDDELPDSVRFDHPEWLIDTIRRDWPQQVRSILEANNTPASTWLRLNLGRVDRENYLQSLRDHGLEAQVHPAMDTAIAIDQRNDVTTLPGYVEGHFSVQDVGAQLAARLLDPQAGDRVLDLCAAPGGKTTQLLEYQPAIAYLRAVDDDAQRMARLQENLERTGLPADVVVADASVDGAWADGEGFHRILLDAPCSATGVIRRHPDIKHHRRSEDIGRLTALQLEILRRAWDALLPGGMLLYITCSVLLQENEGTVTHFVEGRDDFEVIRIDAPMGIQMPHGVQLLPGEDGNDGFYYCLLRKTS